jgi:pantetheine-phosphate adenylyltransferase
MKTCVFAGTFDPFTVGHEQIVNKCLEKFDRVIVVIGKNPKKESLLLDCQKAEIIKACFVGKNVSVVIYEDISDYKAYLIEQGATVYVRGIRNDIDLAFEKEMEKVNQKIYPFIQTEFVFSDKPFAEISSSLVRQKIQNGESVEDLIPSACLPLTLKYLKV